MSAFADDRILEIERIKDFMDDLMTLENDGIVKIVDAAKSYGFCNTKFRVTTMVETFFNVSLRKPTKNALFALCLRKIQDENPEVNIMEAISAQIWKDIKSGLDNQTLHFMRCLLQYELLDQTLLWKWAVEVHYDLSMLRFMFWFYPELTRLDRKLLSDYLSDLKHLHNRKMIKFLKEFEGCDWSPYIAILNAGKPFDDVEAAIRKDDVDTLASLLKYAPDSVNTLVKGNIFSIYGLPTCSPIQLAAFFGAVKCFDYLMSNKAELTWGAKKNEEVRDDFFQIPREMKFMKKKRIEPVVIVVPAKEEEEETNEEEEYPHWYNPMDRYMEDSYDEWDDENLKPDTVYYKMRNINEFAAAGGNTKIIKSLIDCGIQFGDALDFAIYSGHEDLVMWLLENNKTISDDCLLWSIKYNALQILDMILQSGRDVYQPIPAGDDTDPQPVYMHALKMKRMCPLVMFLALQGFDINAPGGIHPPLLEMVVKADLGDLAMYIVHQYGGQLVYDQRVLAHMVSKKMFDAVASCMAISGYAQSLCENGHAALARAVEFRDMEMINFFLSYPEIMTIVPDTKKEDSPLHLACANGDFEIAALLISDPRTNINLLDNDKRSAISYALLAGSSDIVQLILSCPGAEHLLTVPDSYGMISIHHLAMSTVSCSGFGDLFHLIMSYGAIDVNSVSLTGNTCLHTAISSSSQGVDHILAHPNINVNCQNEDGDTPLHMAVRNKNSLFVEMLLTKPELDPNLRNKKNDTPLSQLFPDLNESTEPCVLALDRDGRTQMDIVANNNNIVLSCLRSNLNLLDVFAPRYPELAKLKDSDGRLATHLTAYNFGTGRRLSRADPGKDKLALVPPKWTGRQKHGIYAPTQWSYASFLAFAEKRPEDVNVQDKDGNTPLHLALFQAGRDHQKVVLKFLPHFNVLLANNKQETLLHIAARNGANDLIRALLEKDSSLLNLTTIDGNTALHISAVNGNVATTELLASYRGIVRLPVNKRGHTPVDFAIHGTVVQTRNVLRK